MAKEGRVQPIVFPGQYEDEFGAEPFEWRIVSSTRAGWNLELPAGWRTALHGFRLRSPGVGRSRTACSG
jgi:hypothetical protein